MMMEHYHHPIKHWFKVIALGIAGIFTAVIFGLLFGYIVQWLWNWLMPPIFGLIKITFWQAFGLIILARLIFGSFGHHAGHHPHHRMHQHHRLHRHWAAHSQEYQKDHCHNEYGHDWQLKGGWQNWSYYDGWWNSEGKAAFERYIERINRPEDQEEK
jgi:hypothetical protein